MNEQKVPSCFTIRTDVTTYFHIFPTWRYTHANCKLIPIDANWGALGIESTSLSGLWWTSKIPLIGVFNSQLRSKVSGFLNTRPNKIDNEWRRASENDLLSTAFYLNKCEVEQGYRVDDFQ